MSRTRPKVDWSVRMSDGRSACVVMTDRSDGDLAVGGNDGVLEARRRRITDRDWTWLRQVHGAEVVTVTTPGEHAGAEADAAATSVSDAPIAVHVADCAPVALVSGAGVIAVVHVGWRGLTAGALDAAVRAMDSLGGRPARALVGPCIHPEHYEFGETDLEQLVELLGPDVRSVTRWGAPALDLPAAVRIALGRLGVEDVDAIGGCTAADAARWWSHRERGESGRQAMVAWISDFDGGESSVVEGAR